jgi:hypothetical protein
MKWQCHAALTYMFKVGWIRLWVVLTVVLMTGISIATTHKTANLKPSHK